MKRLLRKATKTGAVKKKKSTTSPTRGRSKEKLMSQPPEIIESSSRIGSLLALEERIMFDGAALATGAEVLQEQDTQDPAAQEHDPHTLEAKAEAKTYSNPLIDNIDLFSALSTGTAPSDRHEIVFIDSSVEDVQTLLSGMSRSAEAVLLDTTRDGIEHIAEILRDRSDIDAIHIISHGDQAQLNLGTGHLTLESMNGQYADEMAIIGQALTDDADVLIYGCNFGEGEIGQAVAEKLAQLTGADVAASKDLTGHASLGGDWELEVQIGNIETDDPFDASVEDSWVHVLAPTIDSTSSAVNDGNEITTISHTTAGDDRLLLVGVSVERLGAGTGVVDSVTYNGVNLSFVGAQQNGRERVEIWSLVAPDTGTHDVVVTETDPNGNIGNAIGVMTFTGVDQATPLGTFSSATGSGSTTGGSVTVSSAADELVFGVVSHGSQTLTSLNPAGTGQVEAWEHASSNHTGAGSTQTGAASTNVSWTWDAQSGDFVIAGVSIIPFTNDAPTITNLDGDALTYNEGVGAVVIDQGASAVVTDATSADFDTGTLTVSFTAGSDSAEDVLGIRDQGPGATNITVSGNAVSYGGIQIGTFTGGSGGTNLVITLDADADAAAVTALVNNITYENTDITDPTTGLRTVRYVLTDGDGGTSANYNTTVNLRLKTNQGGDTSVSFQEGVDSYASTEDTYLDEGTSTTSYGSQTTVDVDLDNGSGEAQALIRFDNLFGSGAGQIPLGATIISATLTLDATDLSSSDATISLYRMLATWSESSTWDSLTSGISTNDIEASSTADATISNPETIESKVITGLEGTLQAWSDGATNYGWAIKSSSTNGWVFSSSENATTSLRPKLTVEYRTSGGDTSSGLLGHWNFDANANDSSGNSYHGTLTNGASVDTTDLTDKVGAGKFSLDGSDDYVNLDSHVSNFSSLSEGTIASWVKFTNTGFQTIFSISDAGDSSSFASLGTWNGQIWYRVDEGGSTLLDVSSGVNTVNDNAWHHVALTVDGAGNKLFFDGIQLNTNDLSYKSGSSASSTEFFDDVTDLDVMAIGRQEVSSSGKWYFDGLLDDVRVYNQALSVADIAALAAEAPVAYNDTATTTKNTATTINVNSNDTDLDSETITVLDVGNPTNGTVVNNDDGTVTYTPTTSYTGTDSFTYLTADLDDTVSYWRLDGNGTDAVGSNDGTLTGTTTVDGVYGDALSFDEVDDKVVVSDFAINNEFSLSLKFKVDDNTGSSRQYFYSHGAINTANSLNIYLMEDSHVDAGMLKTAITDTNDSTDNNALNFDVSHIIGDGQWHTYTFTVASGEGAKVYLDGVLQNSDSRGGDSFNPTTDIYLGAREDLESTRFYGGSLDSVELFNRALSAEEVGDTHTGGSSLATVNVLVNDPPVNNVPGPQSVDEDTPLVFNAVNSNLISISDGDAGSNPLRVTLTATNGTMTLSQITGLTFTTGDGTSDATMVFEGTLTNINVALDGLSFLGDQDFNGAANIQITTDDLTLTALNEDANLQGRYTFDNTGDLGNDDSPGGSNDGTVNGAVTNSDGTRGNVLEFDGSNDYIEITGLMGNPADVSLAAWVNVDSGANRGDIISIGDHVSIRAEESMGQGVTAFFYDGSTFHTVSSGTYIAGNGWHHVAYVFNDTSNTQTLYIDGVAIASGTRTEPISYSGLGSKTFIGQNGNASTHNFHGKIDDALVFDRALTVTEIQNLAFEPSSTNTDNIAITVTAVNDAPVVAINTGATVTEGGSVIITNAMLNEGDPDDSGAGITYTVTGDVNNGTVLVGGVAMKSSDSFTQADIDAGIVVYKHTGAEDLTERVRLSIVDGGEDGAGATVFDFNISVTAANDAPIGADDPDGTVVDVANDADTIGFWRLGESAGTTATDSSIAGNDGTYTGGVTLGATGVSVGDTAADFDGSNDHVDLGNLDVVGSGITMAAWINADTFGTGDGRIFGKSDGSFSQDHTWMLSVLDVGPNVFLRFRLSAGNYTETLIASSPSLSTGQWYHVAATYDDSSGAMALYVDGAQIEFAEHSVGGAVDQDPSRNVWIGGNPAGGNYFDGRIDEAVLMQRGMSGSEIAALAELAPPDYSVSEDGSLSVNAANGVLANDSDVESDSLTVTQINGSASNVGSQITLASGALLTGNADGSFDYDPNGQFESLGAGQTATETFNYTISDGNGTDTATATITITGVNDAPTLTATGSDPTYTEGGAAVGLFSGTAVSTVEAGQTITGVTFTVTNVTDTGSEELTLDGTTITLDNGQAGSTTDFSYSVAVSGTTATVTLSGGTASVAAVISDIDSMTYRNTSQAPTDANRVVSFTQIVDSGGTANGGDDTGTPVAVSTVNVDAVNDAPTLTATGSDPTYTEGGAAVGLFSGTAVSTVEAGQTITGVTFTVTNVTDTGSEELTLDGTTITLDNGQAGSTTDFSYSVAVSGTTATVTLSGGTASVAAVISDIDSMTYRNTSQAPTDANRVVSFTQIVDSGGTANGGDDTGTPVAVSTVNVDAVNDAPTLTATGSDPTYTEGGAAVGLFSGTAVSTVEAGQTITGVTFTVTNVTDTGSEELTLDGTTITLDNGQAGSTTDFSYSVAVSGTTATVTLSGGTASVAAVISDIDSMTYRNTSQAPTDANRVVSFTQIVDSGGTANGGDDTGTPVAVSTVNVDAVNDAPTLTATGSDPTYTEGGAAVGLFSGTAVSTVEAGQTITGVTFTVTNVTDTGSEELTLDGTTITLDNGQAGSTTDFSYSVAVSGTTATVTLSGGTASVAAVISDIDSMTYRNTSQAPTDANRVVSFTQIVDSGGTANGGDDTGTPVAVSTVNVDAVNDAPTLTATGSDPTYTEGGAAVGLFSGTAVSTVEAGQTITGVTFTVTNVTDTGSEELTLDGTTITLDNGQAGSTTDFSYSVAVSGTTATVTLSGGTASVAAVISDIDSMTYRNTSQAPTDANRVVSFTQIVDSGGTANGGDDTGTPVAVSTVNVDAVNDAPTLTATGSDPTYTEGGAAVGLFSGTAVSTVEAGQTITGVTFTVTNVTDTGSEELTLDGTTITLDNGQAGSTTDFSYSVAVSGTTATVTLSGGTASVAAVISDIDSMTYRNTSQAPTDANRVVSFTQIVDSGGTANGGDDTGTPVAVSTVNVDAVNDAPTLTATGSDPTYTEGGAAVGLFSGTAVSTVEAGQTITGVTFTVTNVTDTGSEELTLDGTTITLDNGQAGSTTDFSYSVAVSGTTATVTLSGGTASVAAVISDIDSMTYRNTSQAPTDANRVVSFTQIVDSGGTANGGDDTGTPVAVSTVNVDAVNDAPTLTATGSDPTYTEGGAAVGLFSGTAVSTVEAGQTITGVTFTVTNVTDTGSEELTLDGTTITLDNGQAGSTTDFSYSVAVSGTTATVTLSGGTASVAAVISDIDSMTYRNTSQAPTDANRVVSFTQIVDSGGTANGGDDTGTPVAVSTVNVDAVNDAPTLTATGSDPTYTEGGAAVGLFSGTAVSTVEAGQTITGVTFTVTNVTDTGSEELTLDGTTITLDNGQAGSTTDFSYSVAVSGTTATVTLSGGTASVAAVISDIDSMTYRNTSQAPTDANRVVSFTQIVDSGGTANGGDDTGTPVAVSTVNVDAVNDAPTLTATGSDPTYTEGGAAVGLFSGTAVSTVEAGQTITGVTFTVTNVTDTGSEELTLDGTTITLDNGQAGSTTDFSYSVAVSGTTATVTLSGGTASVAAVISDIDSMTYRNTSQAPTDANRVVSFTQIVDSGGTANGGDDTGTPVAVSTVNVDAVNDAPTLTATGSDPTYTEGGAAVGLFSGTAVSTVEAGQTITGVTFTVTNVTDTGSEELTLDGTTITLDNGQAGSTTDFSYSVAVSGTTATVTLSGGTASVAAVISDIDSMTYRNTSQAPTDANRVVSFTQIVDSGGTANGGDDTGTPVAVSTVNVDAVNDAPTLTATGSDPTYTEGGAAVGLFSGTAVSTVEAGQTITGVTFTVTNVTDTGSEELTLDGTTITLDNGQAGSTTDFSYSVAVSGTTATVTLSGGTASVAAVISDIDSMTYRNTSQAPTDANRVVSFTQIVDSGGTANGGDDTGTPVAVSTVNVDAVNDAPTLTATGSDPTYTEGGAAVGLFSGTAVSTVEAGQTITGVTFTVTNVTDTGSEELTLDGTTITLDNGQAGSTTDFSYSVAVSGTTATVTLSGGTASVAAVISDIDSMTYRNTSQAPTDANRVVSFTQIVDSGGTANGGDDTGTPVAVSTVNVDAVNDAPTLTATGSDPTYTEGGAAVGLFSGTAVSTVEAGQTITGVTFTVTNVTDTGSEELTLDGTTITLDNGQAGSTTDFSYSVAVSGTTATVTLSGGTASVAAVISDIDSMTYRNTSQAPTDANRVVSFTQIVDSGGTANGGDDTGTPVAVSTVNVDAVNDAPTLTATGSDPTYTEGGAAVGLFSGTAVSTVEAGQTITGVTFTVTNVTDTGSEELTLDGTTITLDNGQAGSTTDFSYSVAVSGTTATVTLSGGTASVAAVISDIDSMTYRNTSQAPTDANRVVSFTQIVDSGGTANGGDDTGTPVAVSTVNVDAVNDAPTLTATGSDPTYTEGGAAVGLFSGTAVSTVEAGQTITGVTFTVTNVTDTGSEELTLDGTTITLDNGQAGSTTDFSYSVAVSGTTATVTLSGGTASVAAVISDIDSMTYRNTSQAPTDANRVVSFTQIVDSGGTANGGDDTGTPVAVSTVNVDAVNDAPVVGAPAGPLAATEQTNLSIHGTGFTVSDSDAASGTLTTTLTVGEGTLTVVEGNSGVTLSSGNGTGTVGLTGTVAQIDNLLTGGGTGTITYLNTSNTPAASTTLTVTVNDQGNTGSDPGLSGDGTSEEGTNNVTINVTASNDTPVIISDGGGNTAIVNTVENQTSVTTVLATDVDLPPETLTYTVVGGGDQAFFAINSSSGVLTFITAPDFETPSDANLDGVYEVAVQVTDGNGGFDMQAISVNVMDGSDAPVITSDGGGGTAVVTVAENQAAVTTVMAMDSDLPADTLTYSIIGGADSALFAINSSSGVLTFNSAPDFETPSDANVDGVYEVTVQVADGNGGGDTQIILVTVTDVLEGLPPPPPSPDPTPEPTPESSPEPESPSDPSPDSDVPVSVLSQYDQGIIGRELEADKPLFDHRVVGDVLSLPPFLRLASWATTSDQIRSYYADPLDIATTQLSQEFSQELNRFSNNLEKTMGEQVEKHSLFTTMIKSSGLALSAGLVAWLIRGGAMLTWLLASLPAWRHMDPIPILSMGQKDKDAWARRAQEVGALEAREHHGLDQILQSKK